MGRAIYDSRDLSTVGQEILDSIDSAILAAAYKVRDQGRQVFIQQGGIYKHHDANKYNALAGGIMVGKLKKDHTVTVHALGANTTGSNLWKTRFFVGGTIERAIPHSKGMIAKNEAVDKGANNAQSILDEYVNNAIR